MGLKNSYWVSSGFYSLGARLSTLFFGFGSFYFLVRNVQNMPPAEYGTWALFLTITTIIETSRNGLIQNALIKLIYSSAPENVDKIVTASWIINIFYSLLIFVILAAFGGVAGSIFEAPELQTMFLYYGATLFLLIPFSQFNFIQQAKFSFSGIFWSTTTRQGLLFFGTLYLCFSGMSFNSVTLVTLQTFCTLAGLIVAWFSARKFYTYHFIFDKLAVKEVFRFGKYVMGTNLSSLLFKSIDQLMVGSFFSTAAAAIYNTAIRLSNLIEYPTTAIAEVVYPKSAQKYTEGKEASAKNFFEKSVGLNMAITVPTVIGTFLFADLIIYIIAGAPYAEAANILRITILFGLFTPFFRQFGISMDSSGRPQINFIVLASSVPINLLCNFVGIRLWGIPGAATGTLLSYAIVTIACYVLMVRIFKIELKNIITSMFGYYAQGFRYFQKSLRVILRRPAQQ
jgi:O-antigen/teichoic acid export membrane protein